MLYALVFFLVHVVHCFTSSSKSYISPSYSAYPYLHLSAASTSLLCLRMCCTSCINSHSKEMLKASTKLIGLYRGVPARAYSASGSALAKILASDAIQKVCGDMFSSRGHELIEKPGLTYFISAFLITKVL